MNIRRVPRYGPFPIFDDDVALNGTNKFIWGLGQYDEGEGNDENKERNKKKKQHNYLVTVILTCSVLLIE